MGGTFSSIYTSGRTRTSSHSADDKILKDVDQGDTFSDWCGSLDNEIFYHTQMSLIPKAEVITHNLVLILCV